jgi:zinc protease
MHPYHWPVIGWFPDLNAMTRADLKRHYDTYYVPNNATLIVVGDIKPAKLLPVIKRYFEVIPKRPLPTQQVVAEPEQKGERRIVVKRDAQLPFVMIGYRTPNFKSDDAYALTLLESILSHGKSSRLYHSLVYEQKLALAIGAEYSLLQTDPDLLYCFAVVAPGHIPELVERAVYAEIQKLQQEAPSEQELQRARNQVEAAYIFGQDSNFRQAMLLGQAETTGAGWRQVEQFVKKLRDVKAEDVKRAAQKYLVEDGRTVGILIPTPSNHAAAEAK